MRLTRARDFDWDEPRNTRPLTREVGDHVIVTGDDCDYQTIGTRLVTPRPVVGYTITPTCGMDHCVTHVKVVPPIHPDYPEGVCVYCGFPGDTKDHIWPRTWTGDAARARITCVPACRECNSAINDTYAPTVEERRAIAHAHIRRRYKRYLTVVMIGPSDLAKLGHAMRTAAIAAMANHEATMSRLAWPHDPMYDERAWVTVDSDTWATPRKRTAVRGPQGLGEPEVNA